MSFPPRARRSVVVPPGRRPPAELLSVTVVVAEDPSPETSYLDQEEFVERKAEYESGAFHLIGVRIEAEARIESTTQVLKSPGLWGIESDTEQDEIDRIVADEWDVLRAVLKTVGVPTSQLPIEFDPAWVEWRT